MVAGIRSAFQPRLMAPRPPLLLMPVPLVHIWLAGTAPAGRGGTDARAASTHGCGCIGAGWWRGTGNGGRATNSFVVWSFGQTARVHPASGPHAHSLPAANPVDLHRHSWRVCGLRPVLVPSHLAAAAQPAARRLPAAKRRALGPVAVAVAVPPGAGLPRKAAGGRAIGSCERDERVLPTVDDSGHSGGRGHGRVCVGTAHCARGLGREGKFINAGAPVEPCARLCELKSDWYSSTNLDDVDVQAWMGTTVNGSDLLPNVVSWRMEDEGKLAAGCGLCGKMEKRSRKRMRARNRPAHGGQ